MLLVLKIGSLANGEQADLIDQRMTMTYMRTNTDHAKFIQWEGSMIELQEGPIAG